MVKYHAQHAGPQAKAQLDSRHLPLPVGGPSSLSNDINTRVYFAVFVAMDSAYMVASNCTGGADSDEDEGLLLTGLYSDIPVDDQKFYFHDIILEGRTITFRYSYCKQTTFDSVIVLDEPVYNDTLPMLFAVGMCVCSWYWMGFYTSDIVICADVCNKCHVSYDMMAFWTELYHQTCLEYVFVK